MSTIFSSNAWTCYHGYVMSTMLFWDCEVHVVYVVSEGNEAWSVRSLVSGLLACVFLRWPRHAVWSITDGCTPNLAGKKSGCKEEMDLFVCDWIDVFCIPKVSANRSVWGVWLCHAMILVCWLCWHQNCGIFLVISAWKGDVGRFAVAGSEVG